MSNQESTWRKPRRLYEELTHQLAMAIVQERVAPGEFLPTEQDLADQYGTSRNVVREAIKMLRARGMVEVLHGRGSRVLPRHQWQLSDQLIDLLLQEESGIARSLLELRRILEVEIAALAAQRATPDHIAAMWDTLRQEEAYLDNPQESVESDLRFHRLLAEATGNVLLPQVLELVSNLVRSMALATFHNPGAAQGALQMHTDILIAVAAGNAANAKAAMRHHLQGLEEQVRTLAQADWLPSPES